MHVCAKHLRPLPAVQNEQHRHDSCPRGAWNHLGGERPDDLPKKCKIGTLTATVAGRCLVLESMDMYLPWYLGGIPDECYFS